MTAWTAGDACWWCDHEDVLVTWVGDAQSADRAWSAPIWACAPCLTRLEERVQAYVEGRYRVSS